MIVLKFGGTSVKDAEAFERVLDIVTNTLSSSYICGNDVTKLIVLSASSGITDKLIALVNAAKNADESTAMQIYASIEKRQIEIMEGIFSTNSPVYSACSAKVTALLLDLKHFVEGIIFFREATPKALDKAVSYGERLSTTIFNFLLIYRGFDSVWLDARNLMKTDSTYIAAKVDLELSRVKVNEIYKDGLISGKYFAVTQGFIGSDFNGNTTTLGRGGSDYSAAIFGNLFEAEEIQIWTDVNGVLTADPRIVENTITISEMGFDEVRALAYFGAKVLHPQTLIPAVESSIPVLVLNSLDKSHSGTKIIGTIQSGDVKLHSVVKINAVQIRINLAKVNNVTEKSIEILQIFRKNEIKIFSTRILPDSLIIWFENNEDFENSISNFLDTDFELDTSKTLIGIVGNNMDKLQVSEIDTIYKDFTAVSINESKNSILIAVPIGESNNALLQINNSIIRY
ncbi:MAG: hypothetical protein A2X64_00315 [Ignavibacteria bacterium GWF2_33_9]|nr:MAG: hypothetical protein A2X64_00315 [Ignavibacteria bacterium GWF2_33_9]